MKKQILMANIFGAAVWAAACGASDLDSAEMRAGAEFLLSARTCDGDLIVYDDSLQNGFSNWSWARNSLRASRYQHSGNYSISFRPNKWSALYFHHEGGIELDQYDAFSFYIYRTSSQPRLDLAFLVGTSEHVRFDIADYLADNELHQWNEVKVPVAEIGAQTLHGFWIQGMSGRRAAEVYVDDIRFIGAGQQGAAAPDDDESNDDAIAVPAFAKRPIYTDFLADNVADWSWANRDLQATAYVAAGNHSIRFSPSYWSGLYFYFSSGVKTDEVEQLEFQILTTEQQELDLDLVIYANGSEIFRTAVSAGLSGALSPGQFQTASFSMASALGSDAVFDGIVLQDTRGSVRGDIYVDEMYFKSGLAGTDHEGDENEDQEPVVSGGQIEGRWLRTIGNKLILPDGRVFLGRGANLHDTRSCNACTWSPPHVQEVIRRADHLIDHWNANFVRLLVESYGANHTLDPASDPSFMADLRTIVDHVGQKPGVYLMISLWHDPSFNSYGWPTEGTRHIWRALAQEFAHDDHVIFGLVNEPTHNFDGSMDADVWEAMDKTVAAIREVETNEGSARQHVVAVQGTGGWGRYLQFYVNHPITAGGGSNIAYEVHVYDPVSTFDARFIKPSQSLPVIIGEFGPAQGYMTMADVNVLMDEAEKANVPYLAWTFHMRCPPNLLLDHSGGACGVGMDLQPTAWGELFRARLAQPWTVAP